MLHCVLSPAVCRSTSPLSGNLRGRARALLGVTVGSIGLEFLGVGSADGVAPVPALRRMTMDLKTDGFKGRFRLRVLLIVIAVRTSVCRSISLPAGDVRQLAN